jgi:heavy metal translocating P-type ATPase
VEHILVRVQGMDCTGCEKKLYRSLVSLAELSNIKTSLLLAQAEFDLVPSSSVDGNKITHVIKKMTGFSCSKIVHEGAELELIIGNAANFTEDDMWPVGVTNVAALSQTRILVTYHPKIIGARELLSDDFFRCAKLAPRSAPARVASGRHQLNRTCRKALLSMICTLPILVLAWAKLPKHEVLYGAISLFFATVVQLGVAGQFYVRALNALLFSRMIDMDLLIVISSSTAYVYSIVSYAYLIVGKPLPTGEYFETSALLVTLILVGRAVTEFARQRAVESIAIQSLQSPTATLIDPRSGKETEIDARLLQYDDLFKILPDSSIATDGIVISGESEVNEAMITGEATLVHKKVGAAVVAGSLNYSGTFVARVTRLPGENTLNIIGAMVDEVKSSKPHIQELADRVAMYFVPAILGLAFIVFLAWIIVGKTIRRQSAAVASINAMMFSITVLIVSCPCAIGLAVPMVVVIASGIAAKHGLIFKTAETIDLARKISHVVFDKTGTLTQGNLHVTTDEYPNGNDDAIRSMILGLATNNKHPVSKAITAYLISCGIQSSTTYDLKSIPGNGLEASWNSLPVRAGNPFWLGVKDCPEVCKILRLGLTIFCVTLDSELVAVFGLQDMLRPDALDTIVELKKLSIDVSILSGDNEATVNAIAEELSIPATNTRACCSPKEKQAYVESLLKAKHVHDHAHCNGTHNRSNYHRKRHSQTPIILFVGDGSNDAPSLAMASIGLHISNSTSPTVASSAADVILLRPSLSKILTLIDLSKAFHKRVLFNFLWSAMYNLAAIMLAAGIIPNARIPPGYAGLGEAVSIIPVLGVAVGLRLWKG